MSAKLTDRPAKSAEDQQMGSSVAGAMHEGIVRLAGERKKFDTRESWLERGAKAAGLTPRQARALFNKESESPCGKIVWKVQRALAQLDQESQEATRAAYQQLDARLAAIEAILSLADRAGVGGAALDGVRSFVRHSRGGAGGAVHMGGAEDGTVDRGLIG